jgi:hypothetical protein
MLPKECFHGLKHLTSIAPVRRTIGLENSTGGHIKHSGAHDQD